MLTSGGLARINPDGSHKRFGHNGLYRGSWIKRFVLDAKDRVLAVGVVRDLKTRIVRLGSDGRRDPSFSRDGRITLRELPVQVAEALAIDRGTRLVVGFSAWPRSRDAGVRLLRLAGKGQRDASFGTKGWVRYPMYNAKLLALG